MIFDKTVLDKARFVGADPCVGPGEDRDILPYKFEAVLTDTWYTSKDLMMHIEKLGKDYYCSLKDNRLVLDLIENWSIDSNGQQPYQRIDALTWTAIEL